MQDARQEGKVGNACSRDGQCEAMTRNVLLACTGTRDLYFQLEEEGSPAYHPLRSGPGFPDKAPAIAEAIGCDPKAEANVLALSQRLEERFDCYAPRLSYPILRAALRYVAGQLAEGESLELKLISTRQADHVHIQFRGSDTYYVARVLKRLVERDAQLAVRVNSVDEEFHVVTASPNEPGVMYEEFGRHLAAKLPPARGLRVFVAVSAGIKQMTNALQQQAIRLYGPACQLVYVEPPADARLGSEGTARRASLEPFVRDLVRRSAEMLVENFNYSGALSTLKEFESATGPWPQVLLLRLEYAIARLQLDFAGAGTILEQIRKLSAAPATLPEDNLLTRLLDVYYQIEIAVRQKRYHDAIYRTGLFQETCKTAFFFALIGPPLSNYEDKREVPVDQIRATHPSLLSFLESSPRAAAEQQGQMWLLLNETKRAIFRFATENLAQLAGERETVARTIAGDLNGSFYSALARLRNQTIHYPAQITEGDLQQVVGSRNGVEYLTARLRSTLGQVLAFRGVGSFRNPFEALNQAILGDLSG